MKDSVIEDLKRRIYDLDKQMTNLQYVLRKRDKELNKKIDRIAAAIKTNWTTDLTHIDIAKTGNGISVFSWNCMFLVACYTMLCPPVGRLVRHVLLLFFAVFGLTAPVQMI